MDNIILMAFEEGLDDGFFRGSYGLKDFDSMTEEQSKAYEEGFKKGCSLYASRFIGGKDNV